MHLINSQSLVSALVVVAIFVGLVPNTAHAYIDPGTGSYLVQLIVAGALSSAFLVKTYWQRIKLMFGVTSHKEEDDEQF